MHTRRFTGPFLWLAAVAACGDGGSEGTVSPLEVVDGLALETDAPEATDVPAEASILTDTATSSDANEIAADVVVPPPPLTLYDATRLHEVAITMTVAEWDALRYETRTIADLLGPGCLDGPADQVFGWYHADVTLDGFTVLGAGIRKKGFLGSLDTERPALRIETDHFVADQRFDPDGEAIEHVTLNNGRQDDSRLKQCLAYDVFRAAGIAAPRCSFAHVTLNGKDLGLYVNVEPVKKRFLGDAFGEAPAASDRPDGIGQLWEGALSDFRAEWLATFDPKVDEAPSDKSALNAVVEALAAADDDLLTRLDAVIDLSQFISFWATEVLVGHWDGYTGNTNNFFVYRHQDGRLRFVPWGVDGTFVELSDRAAGRPTSVMAVGALAHRLYAHSAGRALYLQELDRLLNEVWDESALMDQIAAWDRLTFDAREPGAGQVASAAVAELKRYVQGRRAAIAAELAEDPEGAPWTEPLREPLCAKGAGTVSGTFKTTWGTLPIENLFTTGSGKLHVESDILPPVVLGAVGAKAGENAEAPGRAEIVVAAQVVGAGFVAVVLRTPLPLVPGERSLATPGHEFYVYYLEPPERVQLIGFAADGTLSLTAAGDADGDRIEGSFEASLLIF